MSLHINSIPIITDFSFVYSITEDLHYIEFGYADYVSSVRNMKISDLWFTGVLEPLGARTISGTVRLDHIPGQADVYLIDLNTCPTVKSNLSTGEFQFYDSGDNTVIPLSDKLMVLCNYGVGIQPIVHGPITLESQITLWTPEQIETALWLDAADSSTITLTAGKVSQWSDKSGNSRNAQQISSSYQPTVDLFNGKQAILFSDDYLTTTSESVTNGVSGISIFLVFSSEDTRSNAGPIGKWNLGVNAWVYFLKSSESPYNSQFYIGSTQGSNSVSLNNGEMQLISAIKNSSQLKDFINGLNIQTTASTAVPSSAGQISIGSIYGSVGFTNGYIFEVIISDLAFGDENRQLIEGYLAHKWGLTSNLPADHPYKNSAPVVDTNPIITHTIYPSTDFSFYGSNTKVTTSSCITFNSGLSFDSLAGLNAHCNVPAVFHKTTPVEIIFKRTKATAWYDAGFWIMILPKLLHANVQYGINYARPNTADQYLKIQFRFGDNLPIYVLGKNEFGDTFSEPMSVVSPFTTADQNGTDEIIVQIYSTSSITEIKIFGGGPYSRILRQEYSSTAFTNLFSNSRTLETDTILFHYHNYASNITEKICDIKIVS